MKRSAIAAAAALALTAFSAPVKAEISNLEIIFIKTDENGDLALSKGEVLRMAIEQFDITDTNGDQKLEADEVGDLAADPEFSDNDTNKDGSISIEEMITEKLADFGSLDKNGDGFLTLDELEAAYGQQ